MIFYLINTVSGAAVYVGVQEAVNVRVALKLGKNLSRYYVEGSAKILEKNSERVFVGHRFADFPLPGSRSYRVPGIGVCLAAAD